MKPLPGWSGALMAVAVPDAAAKSWMVPAAVPTARTRPFGLNDTAATWLGVPAARSASGPVEGIGDVP